MHSTDTRIQLRPATPDDALALAGLLRSVGWFPRFEQGALEEHAKGLRSVLAATGPHLHLLAMDGHDMLLGYCAIHWLPIAFLQGTEAYVSELFIAPQARGLGVGSQLLDAAVDAARTKGCARIWLINNRERESYARGFYEKHGWHEQASMARFVLPL